MSIDVTIRRITKPGTNIFRELGFAPAEARRLKASARRQMNESLRLKRQLIDEISAWSARHRLKQAELARILAVSRPRVSDMLNRKTEKFTIDALIAMVGRTGKTVQLSAK